jgi:hypothetical protein
MGQWCPMQSACAGNEIQSPTACRWGSLPELNRYKKTTIWHTPTSPMVSYCASICEKISPSCLFWCFLLHIHVPLKTCIRLRNVPVILLGIRFKVRNVTTKPCPYMTLVRTCFVTYRKINIILGTEKVIWGGTFWTHGKGVVKDVIENERGS